jgi:hypothetical protein
MKSLPKCGARIIIAACLICWVFSSCGMKRPRSEERELVRFKGVSATLPEAVILLNELSSLRVNLECLENHPRDKVRLPVTITNLTSLSNASPQLLSSVVEQMSAYKLSESGKGFTISPRHLDDPNRTLDYVVDEFRVHDENLFVALEMLCKKVPFTLAIVDPVLISRHGSSVDLTEDYPHWPVEEVPIVSLVVTNATVRQILTALVDQNLMQKTYWVAEPALAISVRDLPPEAHPVWWVSVFHSKESQQNWVFRRLLSQ